MRVGLRGVVVISIDWYCSAGFVGLGGGSWARRRSTSDINSSDSLCNVYNFGDLTLSVLEIINGDDWVLTLVVVVGKRIVQLVMRMSNGASAEEDRENE